MGIITISRGSYSKGIEIAEATAHALGYECISREVLLRASKDFDIPEVKLVQAMEDAPSFLDRVTHGKEKYIAYIQAALLNHLKRDNVVYHGFACHFFVKDIPGVLRVRIISAMVHRVEQVMKRNGVTRKEALRLIRKVDEQRRKWSQRLYGSDPSDPNLYDLVLHIDKIRTEDAVATICQLSRLEQFQVTREGKRALADMALAAHVRTFLTEVKPSVEVCIERGFVVLKTEVPQTQDSPLVSKMGEIVKMVPAVKGIRIETAGRPRDLEVCVSGPRTESPSGERQTYFHELG